MQAHPIPAGESAHAALPLRPLAALEPDGRITVYVGASYQRLPRAAAWTYLEQLAAALDVPALPPFYRFCAWVSGLRQLPGRDAVVEKFGVSRASAYRWISLERARREEATCFSDK